MENMEQVQWTWVDFELGEDVRNEARLMQDDAWKNAVSDGRSHISHREYSELNKEEFMGAIKSYRIVRLLLRKFRCMENNSLSVEVIRHIIQYIFPPQLPLLTASYREKNVHELSPSEYPFRLCVRSRPLMEFEKSMGAYSCVDTDALAKNITLHDGKMARSGRSLTMTHRQYVFDRVWGPGVTNKTVCDNEIAPLIQWVKDGRSSTLLCFGQTGTGKTYTMIAALEYVIQQLAGKFALEVGFFEIHGKKCYDLFARRKVIHLRSDENEVVHPRGAKRIFVSKCPADDGVFPTGVVLAVGEMAADVEDNRDDEGEFSQLSRGGNDEDASHYDAPSTKSATTTEHTSESDSTSLVDDEESFSTTDGESAKQKQKTLREVLHPSQLMNRLQEALTLRSSEVTERNPVSSRSHAILTIKLLNVPEGLDLSCAGESVINPQGKLTLVDLAGSERNYETLRMTAAMHRESADINYALMALKDCFRAYNAQCSGSKTMQRSRSRCSSSINDLSPARAPYRASLLTRVLRECFVGSDTGNGAASSQGVHCEAGRNRVPDTVAADARRARDTIARHMTTIITTISPTPTDMQHSINSLDHVVLMAPRLQEQVRSVTVEVPINGAALSHIPIEEWTTAQVNIWLATAEGGRFSQLALPPGMTGAGLMQLNLVSLSALFEGQLRSARQDEEGVAWVVQGEGNRHTYLGRALWAALRRQRQLAAVRAKHVANSLDSSAEDSNRSHL